MDLRKNGIESYGVSEKNDVRISEWASPDFSERLNKTFDNVT